MQGTYHSSRINIEGKANHSPGMATDHEDGRTSGHITIYTRDGALSISADTPDALFSLAAALENAGFELASMNAEQTAVVA